MNQVRPQSESIRIPQLDGLRASALLMILVAHFFLPETPTGGLSSVVYAFSSLMWLGVDLFFVLSGYLITGILLRSRDEPRYFARFYLRRALRILPAYYLVLFAVIIFVIVTKDASEWPTNTEVFVFSSYLQNWWPVWMGESRIFSGNAGWLWHYLGHYWTLAIEEQFYFLWPIVILAVPRKKVVPVMASMYVLMLCIKCSLWAQDSSKFLLYFGSFSRCDALIFGAYLAARDLDAKPAARKTPSLWTLVTPLSVLIAVHVYCLRLEPNNLWARIQIEVVPLSIIATLFYGQLLVYLRNADARNGLRVVMGSKFLGSVAQVSYGLYLVHQPMRDILVPHVAAFFESYGFAAFRAQCLAGVVVIGICYVVAKAMYELFEKPILNQRERLEKNRFAAIDTSHPALMQSRSGGR